MAHDCSQDTILREVRDSQIRMEEKLSAIHTRVADLEDTRSRVGWWIIGGVAAAAGSVVLWALNHGAKV